jgi:hypothetical protein
MSIERPNHPERELPPSERGRRAHAIIQDMQTGLASMSEAVFAQTESLTPSKYIFGYNLHEYSVAGVEATGLEGGVSLSELAIDRRLAGHRDGAVYLSSSYQEASSERGKVSERQRTFKNGQIFVMDPEGKELTNTDAAVTKIGEVFPELCSGTDPFEQS